MTAEPRLAVFGLLGTGAAAHLLAGGEVAGTAYDPDDDGVCRRCGRTFAGHAGRSCLDASRTLGDDHGEPADWQPRGRALCGTTGILTRRIDADARAVVVEGAPVCGNCRDRVAFGRRAAMLRHDPPGSTPITSPASPAERTTSMPTTTTDRKKAPSEALLEPEAYASHDSERLRQERLTLNNRLSGLKTQRKRAAGDAAKIAAIDGRIDDLDTRRGLIANVLKERGPETPPAEPDGNDDLVEATQAAAADLGRGERPSEAAMRLADEDDASRPPAKATARPRSTSKRSPARKTAAAKKTAARRPAAKKVGAKKKTAAKRSTAKRSAAKKTTAKRRSSKKR